MHATATYNDGKGSRVAFRREPGTGRISSQATVVPGVPGSSSMWLEHTASSEPLSVRSSRKDGGRPRDRRVTSKRRREGTEGEQGGCPPGSLKRTLELGLGSSSSCPSFPSSASRSSSKLGGDDAFEGNDAALVWPASYESKDGPRDIPQRMPPRPRACHLERILATSAVRVARIGGLRATVEHRSRAWLGVRGRVASRPAAGRM